MRFAFSSLAPGQDGAPPGEASVITTKWYVDPLEVVAVRTLPGAGMLLLLTGGHQIPVDGEWEVVIERIRRAKREARVNLAVAPPPTPAFDADVFAADVDADARVESAAAEAPDDVQMMEMRD